MVTSRAEMKPGTLIVVGLLLFTGARSACAAPLKAARVTQVIQDVKLLASQAAPKPAAVSDDVSAGMAVRTGVESRAELTFSDQTLARLGANTVFRFNDGTRNLDLGGGSTLLCVPKNAGGAQITTAAVTAAITGTTIVFAYQPDSYFKLLILDGVARLFKTGDPRESVVLQAGQMLIGKLNAPLAHPVNFDIQKFMKTSHLIIDFPALPSANMIALEATRQRNQRSLIGGVAPGAAGGANQRRDRVVSPEQPPEP